MVGSVNKVMLIGNVGAEPQIRSTQDGKEIASFTIATSESWKDRATGEKKEKTEWHRIVVFAEGLVGVIKNYVKKGSKIYIEGTLQTRKWVDNAGVEKYTTEVVLQGYNGTLTLLDSKTGGTDSYSNNDKQQNSNNYNMNNDLDDEIPF
jgi:single-strand DNA-binding protein